MISRLGRGLQQSGNAAADGEQCAGVLQRFLLSGRGRNQAKDHTLPGDYDRALTETFLKDSTPGEVRRGPQPSPANPPEAPCAARSGAQGASGGLYAKVTVAEHTQGKISGAMMGKTQAHVGAVAGLIEIFRFRLGQATAHLSGDQPFLQQGLLCMNEA